MAKIRNDNGVEDVELEELDAACGGGRSDGLGVWDGRRYSLMSPDNWGTEAPYRPSPAEVQGQCSSPFMTDTFGVDMAQDGSMPGDSEYSGPGYLCGGSGAGSDALDDE